MAIELRTLIFCCFTLILLSCQSEYDQYVKRELNSGEEYDSLIFDMYIGETKKDFFDKCWQLNRQKLVFQGRGNMTVRYVEPIESLKDSTKRKEMLFYGIFDENDIMRGMDMTYMYLNWAPWNKPRFSDSLAIHLKEMLMDKYGGNEFIDIDLKGIEYQAYVKIDGNRQILVYPKDRKEVKVKMEDLNYKIKNK